MYEPEKYWENRGKHYKHSESQDELVNLEMCVREYLPEDRGILEIGSGLGRVYLFLKNRSLGLEDRFTMCDFVDSFRIACMRNTGILPAEWDGKSLVYDDSKFYFVISFSVLLHVPPSDIESFFKEHVRVTGKYLFIATWYEKKKRVEKKIASHCFEHDYFSLFERNNLRILKNMECRNPKRGNWLMEKIDAQF